MNKKLHLKAYEDDYIKRLEDIRKKAEESKEEKYEIFKSMFMFEDYSDESLEYRVLSYFKKSIQNYIKEKRILSILSKDFSCCFFWVTLPGVNASVMKSTYKRVYYISLYQGFLTDLFENVKNINKEIYDEHFNISSEFDYNFLKLDNTKYNKIDIVTITMIFIGIIYHEIGHIIYGHCDLEEDISVYEKQAREYCADITGFREALSYLIKVFDYRVVDAIEYLIKTYYSFKSLKLEGNSLYYMDKLDTGDHPHPFYRVNYMNTWIKSILKDNKYVIYESQIKKIYKLINDVNLRLKGDNAADRIVNTELKDRMENIQKNKDILIEKCKDYAYCEFIDIDWDLSDNKNVEELSVVDVEDDDDEFIYPKVFDEVVPPSN